MCGLTLNFEYHESCIWKDETGTWRKRSVLSLWTRCQDYVSRPHHTTYYFCTRTWIGNGTIDPQTLQIVSTLVILKAQVAAYGTVFLVASSVMALGVIVALFLRDTKREKRVEDVMMSV